MIQSKRARLIYDSRVEQRHLSGNDSFLSSINSIPQDEEHQDVKRLWFLYTTNRADAQRTEPPLRVALTSTALADVILAGEVNGEWISPNTNLWLSFGGIPLTESTTLDISHSGNEIDKVRNAHDLPSLMPMLPRYEPSAKHRAKAYTTEDGEVVSPMPLNEAEAQNLLLISVLDATDRWAYHNGLRKCFRFKVTQVQVDIYHGFQVERHEVPEAIWIQLQTFCAPTRT